MFKPPSDLTSKQFFILLTEAELWEAGAEDCPTPSQLRN